MICDPFSAAILEDAPLEGLEQHLSTCAACRSLMAGHQGALRLLGAEGLELAPARAPVGPVLGRLLALALLLALPALPSRPLPLPPVEQAPLEVVDRGEGLAELRAAVAAVTASAPAVDDPSYRPFRELPVWLAPSWSQPDEKESEP